MNKGVLVAGCMIFIVLMAFFAIKLGGGGNTQAIDNTGGVNNAGDSAVAQQQETESKTETIKSKIGAISLPGKTLGPEETVEKFWTAVMNEDYDIAMKYISPTSQWPKTKWEIAKEFDGYEGREVKINDIKYLGKKEMRAEVPYEYIYQNGNILEGWAELQKENGVWKISCLKSC